MKAYLLSKLRKRFTWVWLEHSRQWKVIDHKTKEVKYHSSASTFLSEYICYNWGPHSYIKYRKRIITRDKNADYHRACKAAQKPTS